MTEEQNKEVMRLADEIADYAWREGVSDGAYTNAKDDRECRADSRTELEAYLRTIWIASQASNTFPINPNGASKWARLQKHDGAEAIGVVFRTGSGSVGSLVDGRVVWADWLAHPNGSKPESVNAELLEALKYARRFMNKSAHDTDYLDAAIARAESAIEGSPKPVTFPAMKAAFRTTRVEAGEFIMAFKFRDIEDMDRADDEWRAAMAIETPAKVSPCAGHAVQQEADEAIGLAQALEQHRARKIVDAVSALPVGGKHEESPSPFHAGYQLACDEVMHRLLTEEWDGCLTPPGKQEDDEAGGA